MKGRQGWERAETEGRDVWNKKREAVDEEEREREDEEESVGKGVFQISPSVAG